MTEDAPQREHSLRDILNGLRWKVRTGAQWRLMPHDLPPWSIVYQQTQRWLKADCFEAIVHDLRAILRVVAGHTEQPSAAIFDSRTLQSSPESGHRTGYDGAKHLHLLKKGTLIQGIYEMNLKGGMHTLAYTNYKRADSPNSVSKSRNTLTHQ